MVLLMGSPASVMVFEPAVIVPPPQLPVKPLGAATASPAGNVSLKATPVSDEVVLLF